MPIRKAHPLLEPVGWLGMAAIVSAYGLLTLGGLHPRDLSYLLLNGAGSAAIAWHSYRKRDWQPVVLNLIWLAIALLALGSAPNR